MNTPTTENMVRAFEGTQGRATKEPLWACSPSSPNRKLLEELIAWISCEPFCPPHFLRVCGPSGMGS